MRIEIGSYLSLRFGEKAFIGILSLNDEGLEIKLNDHSCFWAFIDKGDNDFKIIVFPEEAQFNRWLKLQSGGVKIIQVQGVGNVYSESGQIIK